MAGRPWKCGALLTLLRGARATNYRNRQQKKVQCQQQPSKTTACTKGMGQYMYVKLQISTLRTPLPPKLNNTRMDSSKNTLEGEEPISHLHHLQEQHTSMQLILVTGCVQPDRETVLAHEAVPHILQPGKRKKGNRHEACQASRETNTQAVCN